MCARARRHRWHDITRGLWLAFAEHGNVWSNLCGGETIVFVKERKSVSDHFWGASAAAGVSDAWVSFNA